MIADLEDIGRERLDGYDVCIVGTGPAGTTVARELAGSGLRVCALESGARRRTPFADALRAVESEGIFIKEYSRERVLGGASTTWAGLSSPLDAIDLAPRPGLARSGWPLAREALLPWWERAAERYRFPRLSMFGPEGFGALKARGDRAVDWPGLEEKVFLACSEPQDFGREWGDVYEREDVDLFLRATVVELAAAGTGRVTRAVVRTPGGRRVEVEARAFALATGGIENARVLLASRDLCPAGLGNGHDQVGRCLMNHPKNYFGVVRLAAPVRELPYHFGCLHQGYAGYAGLRLPEAAQRARDVLNSYVRFEPLYPWTDSRGVEALVYLVKHSRGFYTRWKRRHEAEVIPMRDWSETGDDSELQNEPKSALDLVRLAGSVAGNAPTVARYALSRLRGGAPLVRAARVRNFMEMEPDPENRVLLGERRDALGVPVPVVRHRPTARDRRSLVELHRALRESLAANGFGTLEGELAADAEPWPIDLDASHHVGTTRMGADPATSVVDADLRLHEAPNVYLAGASVFPTSGCANPTFTIVALAMRLAEHLRARLCAPAEVRA